MKTRIEIILFIVFLSITLLFYWKSLYGYFQGDEWFYFTQFLPLTRAGDGLVITLYKSIFQAGEISGGGHVTPMYNVIWFLHNKFFGINYLPYIILSLIFHASNSYLTYYFAKKLTNNFFVGLLAGTFFCISYPHFQAITWVMAYVPTIYSLFFALLSLIFLLKAFDKDSSKRISLYFLVSTAFFFLAILTKESAVILFLLLPIIVWIRDKKLIKKYTLWYLPVLFMYSVFRFGIPLLISSVGISSEKSFVQTFSEVFTPDLLLFRVITYPLRLLIELFVPYNIFLFLAEKIAVLNYPPYGSESSVRGINFLTFSQGAGSDLFIFPTSLALLMIFIYVFKANRKKKDLRTGLIIAVTIILSSALPLILIALYAPWWGYVTFIDSRHLYTASVGGALFVGITAMSLRRSNFWNHYKLRKYRKAFLIGCSVVWIIVQFLFIQNQLEKEQDLAMQRTTVLNKITASTPRLTGKDIFLVTSDTGYYGFGPIPPFQTHLGQVLSVVYFSKHQLSEQFIQTDFFPKKGLAGEGVLEFDAQSFGFFIEERNLITYLLENYSQRYTVHAFRWVGKKNQLVDINSEFHNRMNKLYERNKIFTTWKKIEWPEDEFEFKIPSNAELTLDDRISNQKHARITLPTGVYQLKIVPKLSNIGIFEDISSLHDANGDVVGDNVYYRTIVMSNDDRIVTKIASLGASMKYFTPLILKDKIIELTVVNEPSELNKKNVLAEQITSTMREVKHE